MKFVKMTQLQMPPHGLFSVGLGDDGIFYATRDKTPMFCVTGRSASLAEQRAGEAIEAYFRLRSDT